MSNYVRLVKRVLKGAQDNEFEILYHNNSLYVMMEGYGGKVAINMDDGSVVYPRITLKDGEHVVEAKDGKDKWNMRQYVRLVAEGKDIWIPNYVLLVALGFVPDMLGVDCERRYEMASKSLLWQGIQLTGSGCSMINHIDGFPGNNSWDNLEFVTGRDNSRHGSILRVLQTQLPGVYTEYYGKPDKKGKRCIRFINGNSLSVQDIDGFELWFGKSKSWDIRRIVDLADFLGWVADEDGIGGLFSSNNEDYILAAREFVNVCG